VTNEGVEVLSRDAIPGHNYLPRGVQELRNFYTNTVSLSNHDDPCIWHPWLRISCVLRVMHTRWSAEAWSVVGVEFRRTRDAWLERCRPACRI